MPQLIPGPWFMVLMFSWLIFLIIMPIKVLNHTSPNVFTLVDTEKHKNESWNWPW